MFTFSNCSFINNTAEDVGVISGYEFEPGSVIVKNCFFINNSALNGGTIWELNNFMIKNCIFINNTAKNNGGALYTTNYGSIMIVFLKIIKLIMVEQYIGGGNGGSITSSVFINNSATKDSGISFEGNDNVVKDCVLLSYSNPVIFSVNNINTANYNWWGNTYQNYNQKPNTPEIINLKNWLFLNFTVNTTPIYIGDIITICCDFTNSVTQNGIIHKYDSLDFPMINLSSSYGKISLVEGVGEIKYPINSISSLVNINYQGFISENITITVNKCPSEILVNSILTSYNTEKYLIATLKDIRGNILKYVNVKVNLNGNNHILKTDKNGQVKLTTNGLIPKTYSATITFNGNDN